MSRSSPTPSVKGRDQLKQLLANANKIARVLGDRSGQINGLLVNANTLLAAFKQRSQALSILLSNVSQVSTQVSGLLKENPNLNHVLQQLSTVSDELGKRKKELSDVLILLSRYTAALTEAVGSGPFFKAMVVNLLPSQILQPWVDAGVQEARHRPREVLAQCRTAGVPIPRPQRHPVPQRRAAAGATGAGGHAGSPGTRRAARITVFVHAGGGRDAAARQPAPVRGRHGRSVRWCCLPGAARRRHLAAEPGRVTAVARRAERGPPR